MELFADFIGNGTALSGGTPAFGDLLNSRAMKICVSNNNQMNNNTLKSIATNGNLLDATAFNRNPLNNTTFLGTTLNITMMNNPTFIGTAFTSNTLNSSSMNDASLINATMNNNYLNSSANNSVANTVPCATELKRTASNDQHPVDSTNGTAFPRMPSELDLSLVSYPASELEAVTPSSISSFPLGSTAGKRRPDVTRSTPLKPPKKYRVQGEDCEIKRCKRSLSFPPEPDVGAPVDCPESPEEKSTAAAEKTTTTTRPKASVERRNKRERMRVKQINNTFVTLRNQLPNDGWSAKRNTKKFSKVDTLRMTIDYIRNLRQLITDHDAMFMSAECLALLVSPPTEGHEQPPSSYSQNLPGFMVSADSGSSSSAGGSSEGSDRSGAQSVGSSTTDPPPHHTEIPSSYDPASFPSSSSSSSSSTSSLSASTGIITDFFPSLGSNLSEDLFDAFLADMYMHAH